MMRPWSNQSYPRVVAIGASAGGMKAFQVLIENLPADTGMAFVLLSHILRETKSLLAEILARSTQMPVIQVTGKHNSSATISMFFQPINLWKFKMDRFT